MTLLHLEIGLVGAGIVAASVGYLVDVSSLEFCGILVACIAFGILIARAMSGPSAKLPP